MATLFGNSRQLRKPRDLIIIELVFGAGIRNMNFGIHISYHVAFDTQSRGNHCALLREEGGKEIPPIRTSYVHYRLCRYSCIFSGAPLAQASMSSWLPGSVYAMLCRSGVALVLSIFYEGRHVAGWAWAWPSHLLNVLRGYSCNMRLYMSLCARLVQEVSATWETARHLDDYTVMPCKEVRTSIGICLVQSGDPEPLCKAALRRSSLLSFNDLFEALRCFDLLAVVGASSGRCRTLFLRVLCEYVAPGDLNFQTMVLGSADEAESLRFLAQDPVFEMAWEEMDDDDKHELPEVKKAINRNKARVTSAYQRMPKPKAKRKSFARAKGKIASKPLANPRRLHFQTSLLCQQILHLLPYFLRQQLFILCMVCLEAINTSHLVVVT